MVDATIALNFGDIAAFGIGLYLRRKRLKNKKSLTNKAEKLEELFNDFNIGNN